MDLNIVADIAATIRAVNNWWTFATVSMILSVFSWCAYLVYLWKRPAQICSHSETVKNFAVMLLNSVNDTLSDYQLNREQLETRIDIACDYLELFYPTVSVEPIRAELSKFNRQLAAKSNRPVAIDTTVLKQALYDIRQQL